MMFPTPKAVAAHDQQFDEELQCISNYVSSFMAGASNMNSVFAVVDRDRAAYTIEIPKSHYPKMCDTYGYAILEELRKLGWAADFCTSTISEDPGEPKMIPNRFVLYRKRSSLPALVQRRLWGSVMDTAMCGSQGEE